MEEKEKVEDTGGGEGGDRRVGLRGGGEGEAEK